MLQLVSAASIFTYSAVILTSVSVCAVFGIVKLIFATGITVIFFEYSKLLPVVSTADNVKV